MKKKKKQTDFISENFQFLEVKFSTYLNRHVFVMYQSKHWFYDNMNSIVWSESAVSITKTRLFKYIENFTVKK